jgi:prefoldin subunit 5
MDNVQIESRIDVLEEELGALKREVELLREEIRALARRESEE